MERLDDAHALIIGIADYRQIRTLPPVQDARRVGELLIDPAVCGYRPEHVQTLIDGQASREAILAGLAALAGRATRSSTAVVYFSGHGGRIESGPLSGEYLLPVDAAYPPAEALGRTAISGDEFTDSLKAIGAGKLLVILDCCHAGGIGEPKDLSAATMSPGFSDHYYERLKAGRGRVIFASSRPDEVSYVEPGAEYGLFTEHLIGGLSGGVASDDGLVRVFDLFEYLQPRVTKVQPRQHPLFKGELEENFPVALYRGGARGVVPKVEGDFRYDAFISYADRDPDSTFVWETLVPRLEAAGLRVAVSGDSQEPGVPRIVGGERAIRQSKRTLVVLSERYLADAMADFEGVLAQSMDVQEGTYRLIPVTFAPMSEGRIPGRISMLETLDLAHPRRSGRNFERLIRALRGPLPTR